MKNMKEYEKVKPSKNPYLQTIPEHWFEYRLSQIANNRVVRHKENEELLSVYLTYGVMKYADTVKTQVHKPSEDLSNYKYVEVGNLVLNNQQAWRGSVGVSQYRGIVSPVYYVLELSNRFNHRFANYLFRNHSMVDQYVSSSKGVGSIQRNLYYPYLKNIIVSFPPKEEQDQIVRYLDSKLAKINKFIRNKKRLIELLKEQKQAVINQAVTKGLDPDAKMKPSGVEWLSVVPEGWEVRPLKRVTSINKLSLSNSVDSNKIINYIDISTVGFTELKQEPVSYKFSEAPSRARRIVCHGDTIISTVRTYLKSIFYIDESFDGFIASTGFAVLTPSKLINKKLLNYSLSAEYFLNSVAKHSIGVSYPAISETVLARLKVVIPKNIDEQKEILNYVTKKIKTIDQTIDRIQKEIDLITEYRTSLISAVITGKVDVRGIEVDEPPAEELAELEPAELENEELQGDDLLESEVG